MAGTKVSHLHLILARAAVVLGLALSACADPQKAPLADELEGYTDTGDGCQQVVSAISYADRQLKAAGQEPYQDFTDAVRSSIGAVAGTVALEVRDFPSERTLEQARVVSSLADQVGSPAVSGDRRVRLLRVYRREAMDLVILCAREVRGL